PDESQGQGGQRSAPELADKADGIGRHMQRMARWKDKLEYRQQSQQCHDGKDAAPCRRREQAWVCRGLAGWGRCKIHSTLLPRGANRPCGRFWMNRTMSTRMVIFAMTAPVQGSMNLLTTPRPSAAVTAPASCPTPPRTTTINESTM